MSNSDPLTYRRVVADLGYDPLAGMTQPVFPHPRLKAGLLDHLMHVHGFTFDAVPAMAYLTDLHRMAHALPWLAAPRRHHHAGRPRKRSP